MINPYLYSQCPSGFVPYIIRDRDTLIRIAWEYNTTVEDIILANPGINPYNLQIGSLLCIPLRPQLYPTCPTTNYYVVKKGDTLKSIGEYFNVPYLQLLYSNYGIDPNDLYEDQILCIPVAPSPVTVKVNVQEKILIVLKNGSIFKKYRIAQENPDHPIPRGTFTVLNKQLDTGLKYGARWIGLSKAGFGICGTNTPEFIKAISSGSSIVMSDKDASELFNLVPVGTSIEIS